MDVAIHLPQYGRVAGAKAITRAAQHAEALGYAGVWVSDHVVHPAAQDYPSPFLYDPLVTLVWAASATTSIGLGTSVLVVPQHNGLEMANVFASLDALSGGRLTIGVGVGWSQAEFEALGYTFEDRGRRTDEIMRLWRAAWRDDPTSFHGEFYAFDDIRVLPKPAHDIALWVGGSGPRAHRRAVELGDGFHLISVTPDEARPRIAALRAERPETEFVISLRTGWDPQGMDPDRIAREIDEYEAAGVSYVLAAPWRTTIDDWLKSMDQLASIAGLTPR